MPETSQNNDWIEILRTACAERSQAAVARQTGISTSAVNQLLKGTYKGNLNQMKIRVEAGLLNQTVDCPELGEIPKRMCLEHQMREGRFATANPLTMRMYRACRSGCPHSQLSREY